MRALFFTAAGGAHSKTLTTPWQRLPSRSSIGNQYTNRGRDRPDATNHYVQRLCPFAFLLHLFPTLSPPDAASSIRLHPLRNPTSVSYILKSTLNSLTHSGCRTSSPSQSVNLRTLDGRPRASLCSLDPFFVGVRSWARLCSRALLRALTAPTASHLLVAFCH
ncbi:hypothetical protein C8R44DRAFT_875443 [Mycena epipterygia]|nr:hypothetical protein C8R44DRAFT_875443 [Mycena epipterygia]